jgi:hypothetical protein
LAGSAAGSCVISSFVASGAGSSVVGATVSSAGLASVATSAGCSAGVVTDESELPIPEPPDGWGAGVQPEKTTNAAIKTAQFNTH